MSGTEFVLLIGFLALSIVQIHMRSSWQRGYKHLVKKIENLECQVDCQDHRYETLSNRITKDYSRTQEYSEMQINWFKGLLYDFLQIEEVDQPVKRLQAKKDD